MRRIAFVIGILMMLTACKGEQKDTRLTYYQTDRVYDVVTVVEPSRDGEVRNIIFMIGDGMGLEQVSCAWVLNHGKLNLDNMPVIGLSRTYAANSLITDSAAGGTALAIGQKTDLEHIGTAPDGTEVPSLLVNAHNHGYKTGVVVTCMLNDATPCDFCCHNDSRYEYDDLIADYLTCGVDFIAGGGLNYFYKKRNDHRDIVSEMDKAGFHVVLDEMALGRATELPVAALLADENLPVAEKRGELYRDMVRKCLDMLDDASGEKGFVAMLEGSCIDDWEHSNRIDLAMEELLDFDRTLGDVLEWAARDGHTLVVVTADHATGALTLQDGDLEKGKIGVAFGNDSHNGIVVPIYAFGPGADRFGGIKENYEIANTINSLLK